MTCAGRGDLVDRKSTRLNSSHMSISYAVFCLKKKFTDADRPSVEPIHRVQRPIPFFAPLLSSALGRTATGIQSARQHAFGITAFFFNDTAAPEYYPLSLPDALPV